jgi:phospholipase/carboxylesterase
MHEKKTIVTGVDLRHAKKAIILVHGRGSSAADIISLADHLQIDDYAILAPEATNHSWYPYSFLSPVAQNEPWLSSALSTLEQLVEDITSYGILPEKIYFAGFSQGACLLLEFVSRNAIRWGGVVAFSGGLIGEDIDRANYTGDFQCTPILIAGSDPDAHVPIQRVHDSAVAIRDMKARVTEKIFLGTGHTINQAEIDLANELIFGSENS